MTNELVCELEPQDPWLSTRMLAITGSHKNVWELFHIMLDALEAEAWPITATWWEPEDDVLFVEVFWDDVQIAIDFLAYLWEDPVQEPLPLDTYLEQVQSYQPTLWDRVVDFIVNFRLLPQVWAWD